MARKYNAVPTTVNGRKFASKLEANRYQELLLLITAGKIEDLVLQPKFLLIPAFKDATGKTQRAIYYIADFRYYDNEEWQYIVEECKGYDGNRVWQLKHKMFLYYHPQVELRIIK